MAKVSVIIPTHNRSKLLPRAIESARKAGSEVDIIVIDDASTDDTPNLCSNMASITYHRLLQNSGLTAARNAGLDLTRSEYVGFLDDDDILLPGVLDRLVGLLESDPKAAFAYGQVFVGDNNCKPEGPPVPEHVPGGDIFWKLMEKNYIAIHSAVIRRRCIEEVGGFEEGLREDWHFWLKLTERHPVIGVDEPIGVYRRAGFGSDQMTSNLAKLSQATLDAHEFALNLPRARSAPRSLRRQLRQKQRSQVSDVLIWEAEQALTIGRVAYARGNLITALKLCPFRAARPHTFRLLFQALRRSLRSEREEING